MADNETRVTVLLDPAYPAQNEDITRASQLIRESISVSPLDEAVEILRLFDWSSRGPVSTHDIEGATGVGLLVKTLEVLRDAIVEHPQREEVIEMVAVWRRVLENHIASKPA